MNSSIGRPKSSFELRVNLWGIAFILPAIFYFAIFKFYPMFEAFYISFFKSNLISRAIFVGFGNYSALVSDYFGSRLAPRFIMWRGLVFQFGS